MYPFTEDRSPEEVEVETQWTRAGRGRQKGRFLKGPISVSNLQAAAQLPGHALHLYIATRQLAEQFETGAGLADGAEGGA